jgi:hypothetical protein
LFTFSLVHLKRREIEVSYVSRKASGLHPEALPHQRHGRRVKLARMIMPYRVYSGPRGSDMFAPVDKDKMLFKQVAGFDEALAWAAHVCGQDRTVLLIEGDDGTNLTKHEIAAALQHRQTEAVNA